MNRQADDARRPAAHAFTDKVLTTVERFLQIEAVSGFVLLLSAAIALIWANSAAADLYIHLWETPLSLGIGSLSLSGSLHFIINDGLMTLFFLLVGLEIRREMHEGALAELKAAALPIAAAIGGVMVPAVLFVAMNSDPLLRQGWAVPTATDIAFAVGVLALLGKSIPGSLRIFLLSLAIIDDIAAVIIIAVFYSGGLNFTGLLIAGAALLLIGLLRWIGIGTALAYIIPGALLWFGLLQSGAHPTLAGVILGLLTPVVTRPMRDNPAELARRAVSTLETRIEQQHTHYHDVLGPVRGLQSAQRELLPPVTRVQIALHQWVAYLVMPLFSLANAGVNLSGVQLDSALTSGLVTGVAVALIVGKPIGIVGASWIAVRLRWCELPPGVNWPGVILVGCLGGIGFTMSIFIASLAFEDAQLLAAAKLGVLIASFVAGVVGLAFGRYLLVRQRKNTSELNDRAK
jgi:Na+:H+ antiporter, NhaA family